MSLTLQISGPTEAQIRAIARGEHISPEEVVVRLLDRFGDRVSDLRDEVANREFFQLLEQLGPGIAAGTRRDIDHRAVDLWIEEGHEVRDEGIYESTFGAQKEDR